jgi:hypothetical protein
MLREETPDKRTGLSLRAVIACYLGVPLTSWVLVTVFTLVGQSRAPAMGFAWDIFRGPLRADVTPAYPGFVCLALMVLGIVQHGRTMLAILGIIAVACWGFSGCVIAGLRVT